MNIVQVGLGLAERFGEVAGMWIVGHLAVSVAILVVANGWIAVYSAVRLGAISSRRISR